jgi:hypothetical protein
MDSRSESFVVRLVQQCRLAVVMTFPNGFARTLTFEDGEFVRSNPAMSGVGTDMACQLSDGMHFVRVYDQRSELPKALVFGK